MPEIPPQDIFLTTLYGLYFIQLLNKYTLYFVCVCGGLIAFDMYLFTTYAYFQFFWYECYSG